MNRYTIIGTVACTALLMALMLQDRQVAFTIAVVFLTILSTKTAQLFFCWLALYIGKIVSFIGDKISDVGHGLSHGACNIATKLQQDTRPHDHASPESL